MIGVAARSTGPVLGWMASAPWPLRLLAGCILGAVAALGQAPFDQPLATVLALAVAIAVWRVQPTARAAAFVGWAIGTGYFALALAWIVEPFQVDAARHGWMAPFALVFLSSGLALFWALAFWGARRLSAAGLALALTWTATEMLRAYIFTGFPWASPAQVMVDGPVSRLLAWGGPHGAMLVMMLLAWALSLPAGGPSRVSMRLGQGALLFASAFALYLPLAVPPATGTGYTIRLVQPNAEQHLKWRPETAQMFYERQLTATAARGVAEPDLIVWPETAIPWRLERAASALAEISAAARDTPVALGVLRTAEDGVRNALALLDGTGSPVQIYDKHHLVPFGEYIPLAHLAGRLGLTGLAANGMGFSSGPGARVLDLGPLGKALPLICYEAVFAHGVRAAPERPALLLQITNDAWFGDYAGPQQHLAQARMRAIEQGLPLARAANTGISAMIDPWGRVTASLSLGQFGFVDAELPEPLAPTLYARMGDLPILILMSLGLLVLVLGTRTPQPDSH